MKTSNKLIITAALLILLPLIAYDLVLRSVYIKGDYKDPYKEFVTLNYKDFNTIDLSASTAANIILTQGPYSVRMEPRASYFVKVSQTDTKLHIDAVFPGEYENSNAAYVLVISCPSLKEFNADARYMAGDMAVTDTLASADFKWRPTIISGFNLDTLTITEKHASNIILKDNKIRAIKATIGIGDKCRSNLAIERNNQFQKADLNILNDSQLLLLSTIPNLKYQLADSARLILTGGTQNILKK